MKPGDKVWVFFPMAPRNEMITECIVEEWPDNDVAAKVWIVNRPRVRPYVVFKADCFPTREALCEYYRKIFE